MREAYVIGDDDISKDEILPHYSFTSREELVDFFRNITRRDFYYLDDLLYYKVGDDGRVVDIRMIQGDEFNEILIEAGREELINFIYAGYEEERLWDDVWEEELYDDIWEDD